jgi:type VI secretion system protein ImpA
MPTVSTFDLEKLLEPIAGANPAGDAQAYAYAIRQQLDELRKDESPEDFDDATRPEHLKKADWPAVAKLCEEALTQQSKDLRIACHLAEAQVKLSGFAGLRDSMILLRRLVAECWDRILPSIADGDLDSRSEPLANMLDDADRGIRFPNVVRCVPLFGNRQNACSFQDWSLLRSAGNPGAKAEFDKAVAATSLDQLQATAAAIDQCQAELTTLLTELDSKLGPTAPALSNLATAISDSRGLVRQELSRLMPAASDAVASDGTQAKAAGPSSVVGSRNDAYQQLNRAADFLQQIEPHSPVPYLVRRAVELGALPFPLLMQQLIRDTGVLAELNREMGVRELAASES